MIILFFPSLLGLARGQTNPDPESDLLKRLKQSNETISGWQIARRTSKLDDSQEVAISRVSDDGQSYIVLQCIDRDFLIIADFQRYLKIFNDIAGVDVRFGKEPAARMQWSKVAESRGVASTGAAARKILQAMLASETLFLRVRGYDHSYDAYFELKGLSQAITSVKQACKMN
jgi:hypothetical protein